MKLGSRKYNSRGHIGLEHRGSSKNIFERLQAFANAKLGKNKSGRNFHSGLSHSNQKKQPGKVNQKWKKFFVKAGIFLSMSILFITLVGILGLLGIVSAYSTDLPNIDKYLKDSETLGNDSVIVDRNGTELYRLKGEVINDRANIDQVPLKLQYAFLATEDVNFYSHRGIDIFGLGRSLTCIGTNTLAKTSTEKCGGGSSITQQLIKMTTGEADRSTERKIREAILAMNVEKSYSKDQILEYYLNVVPMGSTYVGVKTGSKYLFDKEDLNRLTLAEMAYIAGIPNLPSYYSPAGQYYDAQRSQERAILVLDRMYQIRDKIKEETCKLGECIELTAEEIEKAKSEVPNVKFVLKGDRMRAPHYVTKSIAELDEIFAEQAKNSNGKYKSGSDYLRDKGYTITLAVDLELQELIERLIPEGIDNPKFQQAAGAQNASAVVMDPVTGEVLAMVGSKGYYLPNTDPKLAPQFNAADSPRSMGSSMKPIAYMTAFTKGYNPSSIAPDLKIDHRPTDNSPEYAPMNYGGWVSNKFVTFRDALKSSLNQPSLSVIDYTGVEAYADMYVKMTGNENIRSRFVGPSSVLGAANISLLDQVQAYSTIAAEGAYRPAKFVVEIRDERDQIVYDNTRVESKQVIEKKYTYLITSMNKEYWSITSNPVTKEITKKTDFAGKTGTSDGPNGPGDITFVGYSPNFVFGMWSGNDCGQIKCPLKGGANSDHLFNYLYIPILKEYAPKLKAGRFNPPEGVRQVGICSLTGNASSPECVEAGGQNVTDWVADTAYPPKESLIEKLDVTMCPDKYKLSRDIDKDLKLSEEKYFVRYEKLFSRKFLSDQVLKFLQDQNKAAPTENCDIERTANPPTVQISSPTQLAVYLSSEIINIEAVVTADLPLKKVELFIDGVKVGDTLTSAPYAFTKAANELTVGTHTISVVATDTKDRESKDSKTIIITNTLPTVTINSPANNALLSKGSATSVSLSSTVNLGSSGLTILNTSYDIKDPVTGTITTIPSTATSSFSADWNYGSLTNGDYEVTAKVTLSGNRVVKSNIIKLRVRN